MRKMSVGALSLAVTFSMTNVGIAQDDSNENLLQIPEDLTITENDKYEREELRVGGRLERVTVRWNNGVTEVYQNVRNDTIWNSSESELGEIQNVRQWRLGSW